MPKRPPRSGFVEDNIGYIPLTQGKFALVDPDHVAWISQWNWSYHDAGYAYRKGGSKDGKQRKNIYMHRFILGALKNQVVDHEDRNRLNNQSSNLRFASSSANNMNRGIRSNNKSGMKGVVEARDSKNPRWRSFIKVEGESRYLGSFSSLDEAAVAYDIAAKEAFGEFAYTNF